MDAGERDGDGEDGGWEKFGDDNGMKSPAGMVDEMVNMIEYVARFGDYRRSQKKECYNMVRRLKIFLPFFDEIRHLGSPISPNGVASLSKLKKAIRLAAKLLKTCNEGSKIYLAFESEAVMIKFHTVYGKLIQALEDLPYDELQVSDEVREQVNLIIGNISMMLYKLYLDCNSDSADADTTNPSQKENRYTRYRACCRSDGGIIKTDERNADIAIVERLAKKLELHTVEDLKIETIAVQKLVKERGGISESTQQQIIRLLNKFQHFVGMEITNVLDDPSTPQMPGKSQSLVIPHEFLCPITLEIMRDPVIVASGQTFERESIQKWFDSNHRTCPKTRQTLAHLSVAPNYALKNLIAQWCEKNMIHLPKKEDQPSSKRFLVDHKDEMACLVKELSSSQLEVQRRAVKNIRMLSKENPEARVLIAKSGAIPQLVHLLSYPDSKIQEHAVTALLNLSIDESNKRLITDERAISPIIEVLQKGSMETRENSAAALFSLSMLDENKVTIALEDGIPPLVDLLQNGTLLEDKNQGMVDEALSILLLLATVPEGRLRSDSSRSSKTLVDFIKNGTPKNKECATSVLLELSSNNSSHILAALQFGVYEHLVKIKQSGTNRAQRKATALLQLMSKDGKRVQFRRFRTASASIGAGMGIILAGSGQVWIYKVVPAVGGGRKKTRDREPRSPYNIILPNSNPSVSSQALRLLRLFLPSVMDPYKHSPSSAFNPPFWTTNSGAPVWNNNSSLTVGPRGSEFLNVLSMLGEPVQTVSSRLPVTFLTLRVQIFCEHLEFKLLLSGKQFPVFFIRDGMEFPDMIRALKPNPRSHIQEDWRIVDFFSHQPERLHMFTFLFDGVVVPQDYRHMELMEGSGVNTYTLINKARKALSEIPLEAHLWGQMLAGRRGNQGLEEPITAMPLRIYSIAAGNYPEWKLYILTKIPTMKTDLTLTPLM
ncbi:U-box domain-containing protein 15 [Hibiscus syriacus]|uniref:RING-type E3 ubiquitin transferase n=1 Tax=Hibiscus syriacus TaxID=106335 RepID=A0A6A2YM06_HIBSY|nr:U-box domain-containing protein 15 [Hibiscus syriacus]